MLTLWRPMSPYGYSYKASCARPSFVIFDILALWSVRVLGCKNYKWRLNLVWHRMLNSGCQRVNIFTIKPRCFRCYSAEVSRGLAAISGYFRLLKWHDNVKLGTILACCGAVIDLKTTERASGLHGVRVMLYVDSSEEIRHDQSM